MFSKESVTKQENILIATGEDSHAYVHLVMDSDEPTLDVIITYTEFEHDDIPYWLFNISGYELYFDIRHVVTDLINACDDIYEYIDNLNDIFLDYFGEFLIESSFDSYEDLYGCECEECEKKDSCEEYLKHKN